MRNNMVICRKELANEVREMAYEIAQGGPDDKSVSEFRDEFLSIVDSLYCKEWKDDYELSKEDGGCDGDCDECKECDV